MYEKLNLSTYNTKQGYILLKIYALFFPIDHVTAMLEVVEWLNLDTVRLKAKATKVFDIV